MIYSYPGLWPCLEESLHDKTLSLSSLGLLLFFAELEFVQFSLRVRVCVRACMRVPVYACACFNRPCHMKKHLQTTFWAPDSPRMLVSHGGSATCVARRMWAERFQFAALTCAIEISCFCHVLMTNLRPQVMCGFGLGYLHNNNWSIFLSKLVDVGSKPWMFGHGQCQNEHSSAQSCGLHVALQSSGGTLSTIPIVPTVEVNRMKWTIVHAASLQI